MVENSITDREVEGSNPASLHSASVEKGRTEIEIEREKRGREEREIVYKVKMFAHGKLKSCINLKYIEKLFSKLFCKLLYKYVTSKGPKFAKIQTDFRFCVIEKLKSDTFQEISANRPMPIDTF